MKPFGIVYGLYDPRDGRLRYVGQTTQPLNVRVRKHLEKRALTGNAPRQRWLSQLAAKGIKPLARVIAEAHSQEELDALEIEFIACGVDLVNSATGGCVNRGWRMREDTKKKLSAALKGRPRNETPEAKAARIAQLIKALKNPAIRDKLASNRGRTFSEEHRRRIAAARTGKRHSEETRAKIAAKAQRPRTPKQLAQLARAREALKESRRKNAEAKCRPPP